MRDYFIQKRIVHGSCVYHYAGSGGLLVLLPARYTEFTEEAVGRFGFRIVWEVCELRLLYFEIDTNM